MTNVSEINEQITALFAKQPCQMIEPLAAKLKYSIPSVRRFLATVGYYRSFTQNGKWYTLRSTPRFNREGLWFYNEIGFSRAGSQTKTLTALASNSPAGLTAEQLGVKLRCRCHTVLVQLYRRKKLQRQKTGRSFTYLSTDPRTAKSQRLVSSAQNAHIKNLPAEIAVLVLVEFIRNPEAGFTQLAKTIKCIRKITVEVAQIEGLFHLYGIKKTMLTADRPPGEH